MKGSLHARKFAKLLTEAVHLIRLREGKTVSIVQDELGYAMGKSGGAMIEYWRKGKATPSNYTDTEVLAEAFVKRGEFDSKWIENFLKAAEYPYVERLSTRLFDLELKSDNGTDSKVLHEMKEPIKDVEPKQVPLPAGQLPPVTPLPLGSIMPFGRNPLFVGREDDLLSLAEALRFSETMAISQIETAAATGLGGIGKTQLAVEFVHRYGQFFEGGVYWLSFDNPDAIPAEIAACGGPKGLNLGSNFQGRTPKEQTELVLAEWQKPIPRLLIFDNCEDPELVVKWRPKYGGCRILLTSRRGNWGKVLGVKMLALGTLARDESIDLLKENSGHENLLVADEIAEELGDLPLALHLAGRYLRQYSRSVNPATYLDQLRDPNLLHHPSLQKGGISPTGHAQNVWRTFAMSYELLDESKPIDSLARRMLVHVAHFAPGAPIWYELLVKTLQLEQENQFWAEGALNRLIDVGLIETEENTTLRMHRLVAHFVRGIAGVAYEAAQQIVEETVYAYTKALNKEVRPMPLLAWQLHLRTVTNLATIREDAESALLCQELGKHLWQISDLHGAKIYVKKALGIRLRLFGEQHGETAESLVMLGRIFQAFGDFERAKHNFDRSLRIRKVLFGINHLDTAESIENVGQALRELGQINEALKHTKQALRIAKLVSETETDLIAEYHNNYAHCLFLIKEFKGCIYHLSEAIRINEAILGPRHPHIALNFHNLSTLHLNLGELEPALENVNRAISIRLEVYGEDHLDTTDSLELKCRILLNLERLPEAKSLIIKVVENFESLLGANHTHTTSGYVTLSQIMFKQGQISDAKELINKTIETRRSILGENHHLTIEAIGEAEKMI